jgi:hypothetical protein
MNILPTSWLMGGAVTLLGLLGLTMAAKAEDIGVHLFGMLLFGFAIAFDFLLIKLSYDRAEERTGQ